MNGIPLTSAERMNLTLNHQEPDRVPFVLPFTLHGAKELGLTPREYFSKAEHVAEGQLRVRAKFRHDALIAAYYAVLELEAWGGETVFFSDGPPNAGEPVIGRPEAITRLKAPKIQDSPALLRCLETIRILKAKAGQDAPILGSVISPFSLPIIQLGFDRYLDLLYERPRLFEHLMAINEEFCIDWGNAQLAAGASAVSYTDPMSSPDIVPPGLFRTTGREIARRVLAGIKGPVAIGFASTRNLAIIDDVVKTGAIGITASATEDLAAVKTACQGRLTVIGNLNGLEMRRWTPALAERKVKEAIAKAAAGGGFVLSEHHGEIPLDVPDEVLMAISEAVRRWGAYPINWRSNDEL